ncbi:MAG: hypothetical protein ABFQ64_05840 [Campylobacterota bacterium]
MNRINPLYIALLLVVVFVFISLKLESVKFELADIKDEYKKKTSLAHQVSGLKSVYRDKAEVEKSINILLRFPAVKSVDIETKMKKESILLSSKSIDKNVLNILMGRLLNRTYDIHSFEIERLSETKVRFKMEIKC